MEIGHALWSYKSMIEKLQKLRERYTLLADRLSQPDAMDDLLAWKDRNLDVLGWNDETALDSRQNILPFAVFT